MRVQLIRWRGRLCTKPFHKGDGTGTADENGHTDEELGERVLVALFTDVEAVVPVHKDNGSEHDDANHGPTKAGKHAGKQGKPATKLTQSHKKGDGNR